MRRLILALLALFVASPAWAQVNYPRISSVTANPAGAATNTTIFRRDMGMDCVFDGTRWLSTLRTTIPLANMDNLAPVTAANHWLRGVNPFTGQYALWAESVRFSTLTDIATSAANYRTFTLKANPSNATLASGLSTQNDAQFVWAAKTATINAVIASTDIEFEAYGSATGTPSSYASAAIVARVICP